jgi:hypothetical protein
MSPTKDFLEVYFSIVILATLIIGLLFGEERS